MPYCGFCGKLCPTAPGLKRHIDGTPECKRASNEEYYQYANSIWDDVPGNLDHEEQQPPIPPIDSEPVDMLDFHLDEDIQIAEDNIVPPPQQELHELPPRAQEEMVNVPVNEKVNTDSADGARYIEYFPEENRAGATWGHSKPLFECLDEEQKKVGGSRWAPFEDEEEWQLAEWLIQNVGQKQTDIFLKLPIVSFSFLFKFSLIF